MKLRVLAALAASLLVAFPAVAADGPVETVQRFYLQPEEDDREPSRFTGPALATFEKNAKFEAETGEAGCLDFAIPFGAQDWDDEEIAETLALRLDSEGDGKAMVTATFQIFGETREITWELWQVGDAWLVADIGDVEGGWELKHLCDEM